MGTLDIRRPEFWDLSAVDRELRRVYDICGGCRRCLPLCPPLKVLFDRMDVDTGGGDGPSLAATDVRNGVDLGAPRKRRFTLPARGPGRRGEVRPGRGPGRARAAGPRNPARPPPDRPPRPLGALA